MRKLIALLFCLLFVLAGCNQTTHTLPAVSTTTAAAATTTAKTTKPAAVTTTTAATTAAVTTTATTTSSSITTLPTTATTTATTEAPETTTATTAAATTAAATTAPETDEPIDRYVVFGSSWIEVCDPFDEASAVRFAEKMKAVKSNYPENKAVLTLIPDKSYYAIDEMGDLALDHTLMTTVVSQNLAGWSMVDLSDLYTWDSFYLTDLHWRQEELIETAKRIGHTFGITIDEENFTQKELGTFRGIYADYAGDAEEPLIVLDHPDFATVTVDHYENKSCTTVYDQSKVNSDNSYDTFLSGASPLTVITNPNAEPGTSLLVFRDSFGSSLVPLLIPNYETITMVDLRYMHSMLLKKFVPETQGDILFLYSARIVNNSAMLR